MSIELVMPSNHLILSPSPPALNLAQHQGLFKWVNSSHEVAKVLLYCKEIKPVTLEGNQSWIFIGKTDAKAEAPVLLPFDAKNWLIGKDTDAGKDWRQEKGTTGWDGWMASLTLWTWVWTSSGSWCWTGRPGMLQSMGSQIVGHNWATELNWIELNVLVWAPLIVQLV